MAKLFPEMPPLVSRYMLYSLLATESLPLQEKALPVNHVERLALHLSLRVKLVLGTHHDETVILLGNVEYVNDHIHGRLQQGPTVH